MDFSSLTGPVLDNTIAALIGALIISALTWAYKRARDAANERKYSIRGEYRAYYEEIEEDGSITYEKADVFMRQKGLKIYADDFDETQDKDWIFEGEIDPTTGHVSGTYKTKSKHVTGLGVCILEQKKNGVLDGVWTGYDESIDVIDSGRYTLIKRLNIEIRKANKSDSVSVLQLLDQELGEDWIHLEDIYKAIDDDFLYVADYGGKIVGFTLLRMLNFDDLIVELKEQDYKVPRDIEIAGKQQTLGFIEAIATDPEFQKRGIGSKLVQQSLDTLQDKGAEMVCTLAWKTEHIHLEPTLNIFEFKLREEFKDFWNKESVEKREHCHVCGFPCHCGSVLFTKALNLKRR